MRYTFTLFCQGGSLRNTTLPFLLDVPEKPFEEGLNWSGLDRTKVKGFTFDPGKGEIESLYPRETHYID